MSRPPDPRHDGTWRRVLAVAAVAACSAFTAWVGRLDVAFAPGAPNNSDLGGHIVALQHMLEQSLPHGNLFDWSHQWFSGYPSFLFYFPLPAVLIAALSTIAPLDVAAKLVAVLAPAALPPAAYVFARALGYSRMRAVCATIAVVVSLTLTHQYIYGGNVLSSVIGEYSYAIALVFMLLYLSYVARAMRGEATTVALTLLLAATALSHVIPTLFAVVASAVALTRPHARRPVVLSWFVAFGLAAFWTVPFLLRSPFMGSIAWTYVPSLFGLFPLAVLMILPWTLGAFMSLRPYRAELLIVAALAFVGAAIYLLPQTFFAPGRGMPVWHLGLFIWLGLGIGAGLESAWRRKHKPLLTAWVVGLVLTIGLSLVQMELVRRRTSELLSSTAPDVAEFDSLTSVLARVEPGQLHWEHVRSEHDQILGQRLALGRIPAFAPSIRTTTGLHRESALLSPTHYYMMANLSWDSLRVNRPWKQIAELDDDDDRRRLRLLQLGVNYFVSFTDEAAAWSAADPEHFSRVADGTSWTLWRVRSAPLIEPLQRAPDILGDVEWEDAVRSWLEDITDTTTWKVYSAPADVDLTRTALPGDTVRAAALGYNSVRFSTSAIGVPHLVRVSYFPNWRARGASGPYRAVPGFMMVVPTQSDVVLTYESTAVEHVGRALSVLALLVLVAVWIRERRPPVMT